MKLADVIKRMLSSDRVVIKEKDGEEFYRGYIGNLVHHQVDENREVETIKIATDIFRKEKRNEVLQMKERRIDPVDGVTDFKFSDLEYLIYIELIVKKNK